MASHYLISMAVLRSHSGKAFTKCGVILLKKQNKTKKTCVIQLLGEEGHIDQSTVLLFYAFKI